MYVCYGYNDSKVVTNLTYELNCRFFTVCCDMSSAIRTDVNKI